MINAHNLNSRLDEHERLVKFLDTMAVMLGCAQTLNSHFPDTTRPDVIRMSTKLNVLFVGDAKNTESPDSVSTQERLFNYVLWMSLFLSNNNKRKIVFAICHNKRENSHSWLKMLFSLFSRSGIYPSQYGVEEFDSSTYIEWIHAKG